jgi:hypothetical protein
MSALAIALSDEAEKGIIANIERGLFEYVVEKRAAALDELTSFSLNEIAAAKGVTTKEAKGFLTRKGISVEVLGYKTKRFPLQELRRIFDEATIRRLSLIQRQRKAA